MFMLFSFKLRKIFFPNIKQIILIQKQSGVWYTDISVYGHYKIII